MAPLELPPLLGQRAYSLVFLTFPLHTSSKILLTVVVGAFAWPEVLEEEWEAQKTTKFICHSPAGCDEATFYFSLCRNYL